MSEPLIPTPPASASGGVADPAIPANGAPAPELLAGKYKTPEDLIQGYKELERKLGELTAKPAPKGDPNAPLKIDPKTEGGDPAQAPAIAFDAMEAEFLEKGELSEESLATLEKGGISRSMAQNYVAGQKALANQIQQKVYESVGGESAYKAIVAWAGTTLNPTEIEAFNKAIVTGETERVFAIEALAGRYAKANGSLPKNIPATGSADPTTAFADRKEVVKAMSDPRYKTSEAYRQSVAARLRLSTGLK